MDRQSSLYQNTEKQCHMAGNPDYITPLERHIPLSVYCKAVYESLSGHLLKKKTMKSNNLASYFSNFIQGVHAKPRSDHVRLCVGQLPAAGAALGLSLDLVALLPGC